MIAVFIGCPNKDVTLAIEYMGSDHREDTRAEGKLLKGSSVLMVKAWDWMRPPMTRKNLREYLWEEAPGAT